MPPRYGGYRGNHCARAQDLLFQSMAEWLIHVAVVAEPYRVPSGDNWVGDTEGVVAITSRSIVGSPAFDNVVRGRVYVSAFVDDVMVVGVYFSPNKSLADFEQFLAEVGVLISRRRSGRVLVAGDLNAKSVAWGCPATDPRGRELEEWAMATGLTVLNRGSVNTCVRQQGGSIVDVTFADAALARRVRGWKVLENVETLSDHRYLRFDISASSVLPSGPTPLREDGPRWSLSRIDRDFLVEVEVLNRPDCEEENLYKNHPESQAAAHREGMHG
ncbi:jg5424 [Pararge aegeria aegeria]|uniref:Jg5424 protein n=1 Tax=Pararge aegeria aegeria TaxID=348720 RepID=A0A8S4QHC7_9NEOP|nr:jg5424 [Pararge aegeria aegeria]